MDKFKQAVESGAQIVLDREHADKETWRKQAHGTYTVLGAQLSGDDFCPSEDEDYAVFEEMGDDSRESEFEQAVGAKVLEELEGRGWIRKDGDYSTRNFEVSS